MYINYTSIFLNSVIKLLAYKKKSKWPRIFCNSVLNEDNVWSINMRKYPVSLTTTKYKLTPQ